MKKTAKKVQRLDEPEEAKEKAQLTFTEEESKGLADFLNFVYKRAIWNNMSTQEVLDLKNHLIFMSNHKAKVDSHIMEIGRLIDTKGK